jgi:basic membrane lipoprotein Med (substrate-binding protein (PBP1-ABC) superfamily)
MCKCISMLFVYSFIVQSCLQHTQIHVQVHNSYFTTSVMHQCRQNMVSGGIHTILMTAGGTGGVQSTNGAHGTNIASKQSTNMMAGGVSGHPKLANMLVARLRHHMEQQLG